NDNGTLSLWKWPEEARGGPFPAARMRPLYQWSLSLSNKEGLVSSLQLCSKEHLTPPSGCGQALVVSTTGGRVILTFLPEDLPTTWEDHEQPRQPSKAPRLSTTSTANGRTRLSAASRVSETGREGNMRLRATEAILVAAAPPPRRAEDYPSWTAIALTWLALFALGFGFAGCVFDGTATQSFSRETDTSGFLLGPSARCSRSRCGFSRARRKAVASSNEGVLKGAL
ncbi:hypothetical protein FOZ63_010665, partial [Perkinsus olseni]